MQNRIHKRFGKKEEVRILSEKRDNCLFILREGESAFLPFEPTS